MFADRSEAGILLTEKLQEFRHASDTILVGIARGGLIVAAAIGAQLELPLTAIVVKKLRSPHDSELAIGAITHDDIKMIDWSLTLKSGINQEYFDSEIAEARNVVNERENQYKSLSILKNPQYSTFIIVDDGVATGASMNTACKYVNEVCGQRGVSPTIVVVTPIILQHVAQEISRHVDSLIALEVVPEFTSVSSYYKSFPQVSDEEVIKILKG